jgi:hypothetical protein
VSDLSVSGSGWTKHSTTEAYVENGSGVGTLYFTVTATGGAVGAPSFTIAAQ